MVVGVSFAAHLLRETSANLSNIWFITVSERDLIDNPTPRVLYERGSQGVTEYFEVRQRLEVCLDIKSSQHSSDGF